MRDVEPLDRRTYARDTGIVARDLLGRRVHRRLGDDHLCARIVETEAYYGTGDPGSHARNGPTPRSRIMFGPVGVAYVYFVYGNHHMLNVVAHEPNGVGAVLIRAVEPVTGVEAMAENRGREPGDEELTNGPGKLCQALDVRRECHNGHRLDRPPLWLSAGEPVADDRVVRAQRVGLTDDDGRRERYVVVDHPYVSRPRPRPAGAVKRVS